MHFVASNNSTICNSWNLDEKSSNLVVHLEFILDLVCLTLLMLLAYIYAFANSEDPDETAPIGAVSSGAALFAIENEFL